MDGMDSELGAYVQALRAAVDEADYGISRAAYLAARQLFYASAGDDQDRKLKQLAREYGSSELLLCADSGGSPVSLPPDMLEDLRRMSEQHPAFGQWLRAVPLSRTGSPGLLVARWLCHLAGFRHRCVYLFLDHPTAAGYTLVQVRAVQKLYFPGCFDVPTAGHVVGMQSLEESLFRELSEELGLTREDTGPITCLGSYASVDFSERIGFRNVEYGTVFCSVLKEHGLLNVRFTDGEVAALAVFPCSEIQALMEAFPERVAPGLANAFPIFAAGCHRA